MILVLLIVVKNYYSQDERSGAIMWQQIAHIILIICMFFSCQVLAMKEEEGSLLEAVVAHKTCALKVPLLVDLSAAVAALQVISKEKWACLPTDVQKRIDDCIRFKQWYTRSDAAWMEYRFPGICLASIAWSASDNLAVGSCNDKIFLLAPYDVVPEKIVSFDAHNDMVQAMVFYHENSKLISGSRDATVKVWDLETQQAENVLSESDAVQSIALHPCSPLLVSCAEEYITLWDIRQEGYLGRWRAHAGGVYALDFHRNGNLLASGSGDQTVKVWDLRSPMRYINNYDDYQSAIYTVKFSPFGEDLFSASEYGVQMLKLNSTKVRQISTTGRDRHIGIISLSCHPKEETIAWDFCNRYINFLDIKTGTLCSSIESEFKNGWILDHSFNQDGTKFAIASKRLEIIEP